MPDNAATINTVVSSGGSISSNLVAGSSVNTTVQNGTIIQSTVTGGAVGPKGDTGAAGAAGATGATGPGVPTGGTANQVLAKIDATNYNTRWVSPSSGSGDMTKAVYDPTAKNADAFSMDNMAQGTTNKYISGAEKTVLDATSGTNTGDETTSTIKTKLGITTLSGSNTGDQTITLSGDVTGSGTGAITATVGTNVVTNTKAAQMAAGTLKGNNTGSTANPIDLTAAQATAMLPAVVGDSGSGGTKGLVPAPASGDAAAAKFLKADGTWSVPAGSGSSPLTTKGDLYTYSTTNARLPVGTDGLVLAADSTQTTGLKWVSAGGTGNMNTSTYDAAGIAQQLVGTTATQTLTNKTLTAPQLSAPGINTPTNSAIGVVVDPGADANKGIVVFAHSATQSGNLIEAQNSSFSPIYTVDKTGNVTAGGQMTQNSGKNVVDVSTSQALTNKNLTDATNTFPTFNQNTTGTAANVTGTVAIANGGTGQTTQQAAINALTGTQTTGKYLRSNGTNASLSSIVAADVPTLNQNTTGSAASFTGSLAGDVTGTQSVTVVGKVNGVAISAGAAGLAAALNNATTRSATATLVAGEETVFTGSTASQTLTLPASPLSSTINTIANTSSVNLVVAAGAGNTISNNGTVGSLNMTAGGTVQLVYIATVWYVISFGSVATTGGGSAVYGTGPTLTAPVLAGASSAPSAPTTGFGKLFGVGTGAVRPHWMSNTGTDETLFTDKANMTRNNNGTQLTESSPHIEYGWGYVNIANGVASGTATITFKTSFSGLPIVTIAPGGDSGSGTTYGSGGNNIEAIWATKASGISATGFTAYMMTARGNTLTSTANAFFQWTAIGA